MVRLWRGAAGSRPVQWWRRLLGGREGGRVVLSLAGVLALNTADGGMLGALAGHIEQAFGIEHTRFGVVVAAASAMGAIGAPVAGVLADRTNRVRILTIAIVAWALAMAATGLSTGYWWLLASRVALGAALAAATPVVTSLIGDYFHPSQRSQAYGLILMGELVGAGIGLLTGGLLGSLISWRAAFFAFAGASVLFAAVLVRVLKEPQRGGASWIASWAPSHPVAGVGGEEQGEDLVAGPDVQPAASRILRAPSQRLPPLRVARYLFSIPSFRRLVVASAVGYFFFAGVRTFVVIFATRFYGLAEAALALPLIVIGAAAVIGTIFGGRLADALLHRGSHTARIMIAATGYVVAAIGFAPGLLATAIPLAVAFFSLGAAGLAAANPPLDAARLDIVPSQLWGRGESVRTLTRLAAEAIAPIVFGVTADYLGGREESGRGLRNAFLVMLVPLALNGALVTTCRRTYPTDTATATASSRAGRGSA